MIHGKFLINDRVGDLTKVATNNKKDIKKILKMTDQGSFIKDDDSKNYSLHP